MGAAGVYTLISMGQQLSDIIVSTIIKKEKLARVVVRHRIAKRAASILKSWGIKNNPQAVLGNLRSLMMWPTFTHFVPILNNSSYSPDEFARYVVKYMS